MKYLLIFILAGLLGACASPLQKSLPSDISGNNLTREVKQRRLKVDKLLAQILDVKGPRTIENTLEPYNEMMIQLDAAFSDAGLASATHPSKEIRDSALKLEQELDKFGTDLSLNRDLFEALSSVDVSKADKATQHFHKRMIKEFKRAGVDKDEETRAKIAKLKEELTKITQTFSKNIREDVRSIEVQPSELKGLPQDYIDSHKPGKNGKVKITTNYPDVFPFLRYANSPGRRRELFIKYYNRGYPKNVEVFNEMLSKRYELAKLLGYDNWADYNIENKMMRSYKRAQKFIDRITKVATPRARKDYQELLNEKRKRYPETPRIYSWERGFWSNKVKEAKYKLDPQEVRQYFNFKNVKEGLFQITQKLFGVTYKKVTDVKLWHEDVEAWDIFDDTGKIGRFYLDLFPRDNKYKHAAQFPFRRGLTDRQYPQATLVTNFPNPRTSEGIALMEHSQVETFFHEFGHLLHTLFAGKHKWVENSGISTEWDFVETPSQMLEEWVWDLDTLQLFAKHHKTGQPLPKELFEKMLKAKDFGVGMGVRRQMFYAGLSLNLYNRNPKGIDVDAIDRRMQYKYAMTPPLPNTYTTYSFGHLTGYAASYYTYMWSQVIAKDLFSVFEEKGLFDPETAAKYRKTILAPGGSKPASELVREFLGRSFNYKAFEKWLR